MSEKRGNMSNDRIKEAIQYANGSNRLENQQLSNCEQARVFRGIKSQKSTEFVDSVLQYVKKSIPNQTGGGNFHGKN